MERKKVLVVGCGGLGGYVVEELARLGVKDLVLVDGDVFCESNANRQLESGTDTFGQKKALVYRERLAKKFGINAEIVDAFLTEENAEIVEKVDLVMDCVDNVKTRLFLEKTCEKHKKVLVHGGLEGSFGQACLCYPGDKTLEKLYVNKEEKNHQTNVFTVATVASVQVALAKKVLDGKDDEVKNRLYLVDMESISVEEISI